MQTSKLLATMLFLLGACASDHKTTPDAPGAPTPTSFKLRIENVAPWTVLKSGSAGTQALASGDSIDIAFTAGTKQYVSFAAMLGESNDWFFAPGPAGIALYDSAGNPVSGDVTSQVALWNAGTEIDQEPAVGDATGPNQPSPDYGAPDPDPTVRQLGQIVTLSDGSTFTLPAIDQMIKATLIPGANRTFTLHIVNVSTATTLVTSRGARAIHISPAVWALHIAPGPLFTPGQVDRGQGLELVAESGRVAMLTSAVHELTGWATPISPGVYAVHRDPEPLYALGVADRGDGLEQLAEAGDNTVLSASTARAAVSAIGAFDMPVGAAAKAPAIPGGAFEISVSGVPGDRISFASMFGMSDDWFFASAPEGIALFDADGTAVNGEVTDQIRIYDAGTEIDEELAIGPDTGPQQAMPDQGAADPIRLVREANYPVAASSHLRVTLVPQQ
jgi:hypothetical protein